ncbi:bifunctional transcriptional activator/DNA repair enzyme AdaA [Sphingomonas endophytica]|uniref:bifunctional transcriptional activator/DNA repair enzyme AdaA n=1 Tax=Sphingomonas endophytica TaxID=869719 RepID=UPI0007364A5B|nr:Ada metal-binding domain-containing protein [Sphingomonas endophytica]
MDAAIDFETAWDAFARRDRAFDGRFVVAVRTTGIYCKPSCAARRPRREHVDFLADSSAARAAGYRACRRCLPDSVARDRAAVIRAATLLDAAEPPALTMLAAAVDYAPHHFHRLFRRLTGVTPAALARTLRADRAAEALRRGDGVTAAIYKAGYGAPSRFYAEAARLGMTPRAFAEGGAGETIGWTVLPAPPGALLLARTARGWCRFAFEAGADDVVALFPAATLLAEDAATRAHAERLVARAAATDGDASLPLPLRRLAFRALLHELAAHD